MMKNRKKTSKCIKCGTCCTKGGPTLHKEDRKILAKGYIKDHQMITIRKGELAFSPLTERLEPVRTEMIKVAGKGQAWECLFYDKKNSSCVIYPHRPLECRLMECHDTKEILSVIGKNTLTRADIIDPKAQVLKFIKIHEKECSVKKIDDLLSKLSGAKDREKNLNKITELVQIDLEIRKNAVSEFNLSLGAELFYFGRPLFKHLKSIGILSQKRNSGIPANK